MQISYQSDGSVLASTKNKSVRLGAQVVIDNYVVPGAGEYDVAAIQCEAHAFSDGLAYFVHLEDLTISYLTTLTTELTKLDEASSTDILVVDLRSDNTAEQFKPILKALEPSYVFLTGSGATPELIEKLGLTKQEGDNLKVTKSSLPMEGTFLISQS